MKNILALFGLFTAVNAFSQIQPTAHGLTAIDSSGRQWFWVAFPDTNSPTPSQAIVTTRCEPTVYHVGDHWQIKFKDVNSPEINPLMTNLVYLGLLKQMGDIDTAVQSYRARIAYLENIERVKVQGAIASDGNHGMIDPLYARIAELGKVRATLEVEKLKMEPTGMAGSASAPPLGMAQPVGDDPAQPTRTHHQRTTSPPAN